ncbi:NAD(P)-dependent dehydrogenase (short-subunit alcohol dehydrogenase family) [Streptomonospora nanhaiensis]|uniref:NAD(P)-dependent dehydrogenase (Short-subunit alcohol dehydrogenase family) n=1 Tax=Streptomonospora nanhaiensis TaxID=1323731 RepID=A0A853BU33_9ACTN|nr:SDR family oxidoreductase [Streptomonospora nanhaiensis]NYI98266.1 NAD(P)-dependent dehydrogenase (short-subunit alcohol dehydrogenase family) [Streptomonospora nanhaiensis]
MPRPIALITGAGSGIGAAIAARLAVRHDLILTHLANDDDLRHVVGQAQRAGADVVSVIGDLTREATIGALEREIDQANERLAILVSNAGAYPRTPWNNLDLPTFRHQVETNLITHAACAKLAAPALCRRGVGRIIAVSSVLTQLGRVELAGYIAAKSGLEGLVRALARELGLHGVTVNCIRAGSIEVPAERAVVDDPEAMVGRQLERQCIKRRGRPEDIAAAVEFLVSPDAGFITGQCLTVDGGWCMT